MFYNYIFVLVKSVIAHGIIIGNIFYGNMLQGSSGLPVCESKPHHYKKLLMYL